MNDKTEKTRGFGKYAYRITVCILCILILIAFLIQIRTKKREPVSKTAFFLDTVVSVTLYDTQDENILNGAMDVCSRYDGIFSPTRSGSDIYKMNHREPGANRYMPDDPSVLTVIGKGLEYGRKTDGAFDITVEPLSSLWDFKAEDPSVPSADALKEAALKVDYRNVTIQGNEIVFADDSAKIDVGAVAKGYIADQIKEYLLKNGVKSAVINLGGNVLCVGQKPDKSPFTIGLQKPYADHTETVKNLKIRDLSVVSSGVYERHFIKDGINYHHILNPKTGMPYENGITAVSIVGPVSLECDALSTACFSLGKEKGMDLINSMSGYYGYFILDDGEILNSAEAQ